MRPAQLVDIKGHPLCAVVIFLLPLAGCATAFYANGMADYKIGWYTDAVRQFSIAAKHGDAKAQNMLGWLYANGLGTPKNLGTACSWYAEAAKQGLPDGINNLAACYESPAFIQQDTKKAIALYTLAARKGQPQAQASLIRLGQPVPATDSAPGEPAQPAAQQPVPQSPSAPVVRQAPQNSASASSNSGSAWAALAVLATQVFAASKGYATAPAPAFAPPVHCVTSGTGQLAFTNCY